MGDLPRNNPPAALNIQKKRTLSEVEVCTRIRHIITESDPQGVPFSNIEQMYEDEYGEKLPRFSGWTSVEGWMKGSLVAKSYVKVQKMRKGPVYVYLQSWPATLSTQPDTAVCKKKPEPAKEKNDSDPTIGNGFNFINNKRSAPKEPVGLTNAATAEEVAHAPVCAAANETIPIGDVGEPDPKRARVQDLPAAECATVTTLCVTQNTPTAASPVAQPGVSVNTAPKIDQPQPSMPFPLEYYKTHAPPQLPQCRQVLQSPDHQIPIMNNSVVHTLSSHVALTPCNPCVYAKFQPYNRASFYNCGPQDTSAHCSQGISGDLLQVLSKVTSVLENLTSNRTPASIQSNVRNSRKGLVTENRMSEFAERVIRREQLMIENISPKFCANKLIRISGEEFTQKSFACKQTLFDLEVRQARAWKLLDHYMRRQRPWHDVTTLPDMKLINPFVININGLPDAFQWEDLKKTFPLACFAVLDEYHARVNSYWDGRKYCRLLFWSTTDARNSFTEYANTMATSNVCIDFGRFEARKIVRRALKW